MSRTALVAYCSAMSTDASAPGRRRRTSAAKGDAREQAILDCAEELLGSEGFERMTVEAIAKGAGISRAALYFYFGSKQEVLTALVRRTTGAIATAGGAAAADVHSSREHSIELALRSTESSWREHGRLMQAAVELGPAVPEIGRLWLDTVHAYVDAMTEVLTREDTSGRPGPTDAAAVARALCWMTERNFYWSYCTTREADLSAVTATCLRIWCAALDLD